VFCKYLATIMPITQESWSTPALSSIHPQMHTPISIYNIPQTFKKASFIDNFSKHAAKHAGLQLM
jgi:hypothetical protein